MRGNVLQDLSSILQFFEYIYFAKMAQPFSQKKIQSLSPNFVHFMYLILIRREFWRIPLRRNDGESL